MAELDETVRAGRPCDQFRGRGQHHNQALRQLANRLVGILHGCLQHRQTYNEDLAWATSSQKPLDRTEGGMSRSR